MRQINTFDIENSHAPTWKDAGLYSGIRGEENRAKFIKPNTNLEYVRNQPEWDGITIFTDRMLPMVKEVDSKIKVGLLMESPIVWGHIYDDIKKLEDSFDLIFTHDKNLLSRDPLKYKFIPADWVSVEEESHGLHEKTRLVSKIYSLKGKTEYGGIGDRPLRHTVAERFADRLDLFGEGSPKGTLDLKSDSLVDYMFSIPMENAIKDYYYTEKILDCFITGNVPIFFGARSVSTFFDERGILFWNSLDELGTILKRIGPELYKEMEPYVKINYELATKYIDADDTLCGFIDKCLENPKYDTMENYKYENSKI